MTRGGREGHILRAMMLGSLPLGEFVVVQTSNVSSLKRRCCRLVYTWVIPHRLLLPGSKPVQHGTRQNMAAFRQVFEYLRICKHENIR
jgi:hypothetical protein